MHVSTGVDGDVRDKGVDRDQMPDWVKLGREGGESTLSSSSFCCFCSMSHRDLARGAVLWSWSSDDQDLTINATAFRGRSLSAMHWTGKSLQRETDSHRPPFMVLWHIKVSGTVENMPLYPQRVHCSQGRAWHRSSHQASISSASLPQH